MKTMLRYCLVVLFIMSLKLLAQDDMSNLRSKFQQMEDNFADANKSGDVKTLMNFYTDDAILMAPYESMSKGRDETFTRNSKEMQGKKFQEFSGKVTDVFVSGDLAYEIGTYNVSFTTAQMTEPMKDQGKYVNIWQKQPDNTWKLKVETWNSDLNPKTMAGAKEKEGN
jgi:ketosteroid isomerase-like protein